MLFKKKERKKEKRDYRCVAAMSFDKICCFKSIEKPRLRKDASVYFYVCCNIIMSGTESAADVAGNMPSFHFPTLPNEIIPSANNNATGSHHPPSVDQIAPIMHRPEFVSRARTYPQQLQQQPPPQVYPGSTSLGVVSHPSQAKASSTTVVNCLAHPGSDSCAHGPATTVVVSQDPFAPIPLSRSFSEKQQDDNIGIEENSKVV